MNQKFVKGILLILGVFLAAVQTGNVVWPVTIITAICLGGGYFVKNIWFQSASEDQVFDWRDVISAILLSIFATIGDSVGNYVVGNLVDITALLKTIGTIVLTYFGTTFFENAKALKKV